MIPPRVSEHRWPTEPLRTCPVSTRSCGAPSTHVPCVRLMSTSSIPSSNMNVTEFTIDFHHRYYYSPCQDGQRTKTFFWTKNPPMCQGVSLPAPVVVNCSETQTVCPAGQFLEILEYHIPFFLFLSFTVLPPVLCPNLV